MMDDDDVVVLDGGGVFGLAREALAGGGADGLRGLHHLERDPAPPKP
jgi:hypothetical protein